MKQLRSHTAFVNKAILLVTALVLAPILLGGSTMAQTALDFTVNDIDGNSVDLSQFKGKVVLIVNTASKCGFTYQYEDLQKLYTKYQEQGFVVLGFPSNDFMSQEPGTDAEIKTFCSTTYGVTFPMFSKMSVKGEGQSPLYAFLTGDETNPKFSGKISWNFNKFLIGIDGVIINRFGSRDKPLDPKITEAVEAALGN